MSAFAMDGSHPEAKTAATQDVWRSMGVAMLSVRIIQGFIYWGGGSRRFIYAPSKLDYTAPTWMANKFHTAMPGALLGMDHVIDFMLRHFWVLYPAVILFSAAELLVGLALMAGFATRAAAAISMAFSVVLMLMFGWQGATCIDEWTMAAANLAMGATLFLAGSGAYAMDNVLLRRNPARAGAAWFQWGAGATSLPLPGPQFQKLGLWLLAFVLVFDISTYSHYRGSVITPFHGGPVSPTQHHLSIESAVLLPGNGVRFHIYLDGGTPEAPAAILTASVLSGDQTVMEWNAAELATLPKTAIVNDYAYNKFRTGPFGLLAGMGAKATITLPGKPDVVLPANAGLTVQLTTVNGKQFTAKLARQPTP